MSYRYIALFSGDYINLLVQFEKTGLKKKLLDEKNIIGSYARTSGCVEIEKYYF